MNPRALHFGAEEIDLRTVPFTEELLACVTAHLVKRHRVLPVLNSPPTLGIALANPADFDSIDAVYRSLQRDLELWVADASQLDEFIERLYGLADKG